MIVHYGTDKYKSIFSEDKVADVKSMMQNFNEIKV